jgi:hypothetical protein
LFPVAISIVFNCYPITTKHNPFLLVKNIESFILL